MLKHYRLYDLELVSEFDLPEVPILLSTESELNLPKVQIVAGMVPDTLEDGLLVDGWFWCSPTKALFKFEGIADFLVEEGHTITVALAKGAPESDMRMFLFGSAIGAALHQLQLIPLHVSAVDTPFGVWAFTGDSGAGKSTIAAALSRKNNWPLLCDDVAVLKSSVESPSRICFGVNRVKLWGDAIDLLDIPKAGITKDLLRADKYHVPGTIQIDHSRDYLLNCIVQLSTSETIEIAPLPPSQTFKTIMNCIYRPSLVHCFGDIGKVTHQILPMAAQVRGFVFRRPRSLSRLHEGLEAVEDVMKKA